MSWFKFFARDETVDIIQDGRRRRVRSSGTVVRDRVLTIALMLCVFTLVSIVTWALSAKKTPNVVLFKDNAQQHYIVDKLSGVEIIERDFTQGFLPIPPKRTKLTLKTDPMNPGLKILVIHTQGSKMTKTD